MYYDISQPYFPEMIVYPGDPPFSSEEVLQIQRGDVCNLSRISMGSHTGTHIDAPKHFFDEGLTVDKIPLEHFLGRAKVYALMGREVITEADLATLAIQKNEIILLKTDNSLTKKNGSKPGFTYLTSGAARYLAQTGIRTLGFDHLTIEKPDAQDFEVHKILLGQNIIIIEGLVLGEVPPGEYQIAGFPLNIKNGNGSPIRVALFD